MKVRVRKQFQIDVKVKKVEHISDQVFISTLKSMISSTISYCPKEILIELSYHFNTIYLQLKDPILKYHIENNTVKQKDIV